MAILSDGSTAVHAVWHGRGSVETLRRLARGAGILSREMATRMLIVDDHDQFRGFARQLLTADGFDVTAEAADGESAVEVAAATHPDVVLLDVQLPGIDGFEVARRLAELPHPPRVVLTSSRQAADYGTRLTGAPIRGFIPKQELSGDGVSALLGT